MCTGTGRFCLDYQENIKLGYDRIIQFFGSYEEAEAEMESEFREMSALFHFLPAGCTVGENYTIRDDDGIDVRMNDGIYTWEIIDIEHGLLKKRDVA